MNGIFISNWGGILTGVGILISILLVGWLAHKIDEPTDIREEIRADNLRRIHRTRYRKDEFPADGDQVSRILRDSGRDLADYSLSPNVLKRIAAIAEALEDYEFACNGVDAEHATKRLGHAVGWFHARFFISENYENGVRLELNKLARELQKRRQREVARGKA